MSNKKERKKERKITRKMNEWKGINEEFWKEWKKEVLVRVWS